MIVCCPTEDTFLRASLSVTGATSMALFNQVVEIFVDAWSDGNDRIQHRIRADRLFRSRKVFFGELQQTRAVLFDACLPSMDVSYYVSEVVCVEKVKKSEFRKLIASFGKMNGRYFEEALVIFEFVFGARRSCAS